jgi:hypothetical protein
LPQPAKVEEGESRIVARIEEAPSHQVVVESFGSRRMADPSRSIESILAALGGMEKLLALHLVPGEKLDEMKA